MASSTTTTTRTLGWRRRALRRGRTDLIIAAASRRSVETRLRTGVADTRQATSWKGPVPGLSHHRPSSMDFGRFGYGAAAWAGALRCGDLLCQFRLTHQACQSILTGMDIEKLSVNLSSDDPAIGLRASLALHRLAERVEANHVASAREKGWSWQQIGDALGVTRQSVHTKYNKESS